MVMKDSYGFEAKGMAREKERDFIAKHYSEKERKNLKVLTLLGHEDYELKQIWDPLGVPRENITVVEVFSKPYKILQSSNFGINLAPRQSIDDFVQTTNQRFDVINLDYQGYFNIPKRKTLEKIRKKGLLGEKGILSTWYFGSRENNQTKLIYSSILEDTLGKWDEKAYKERSNIISSRIISLFLDGDLDSEPHPLISKFGLKEKYFQFLEKSLEYRQINKNLLGILEGKISKEHLTHAEDLYRSFLNVRNWKLHKKGNFPEKDRENLLRQLHKTGYAGKYISGILDKIINYEIEKQDNIKSKADLILNKNLIKEILHYQNLNNMFATDSQVFSYVNDKGVPMLVDFHLFEKNILNGLPSLKKCGRNVREEKFYLDGVDNLEKNKDKVNKFIHSRNKARINHELPRKKLETNKELTKEKAIQHLRNGLTPKEISQKYKGFTEPQLRALKAWYVTMGKEDIA